MNKREQYHLTRMLSREVHNKNIKIVNTPSIENILTKVFNLRVADVNHDGWYNRGFIFFRFLNDYIEIKTISSDTGTSIILSMDVENIKFYFNYLQKLEGKF